AEGLGLRLARLAARGLDLALEQEHRLVGLAAAALERPETPGDPPQRKPGEGYDGHHQQQEQRGAVGHQDAARALTVAPTIAAAPAVAAARGAGRRPRQWRHTGLSPHGSQTSASRRFRHWPDMRL